LERALPGYLLNSRWFGAKAQQIRSVKKVDVLRFNVDGAGAFFATWEVQYLGATPEIYLLPLAFVTGERAFELRQSNPQAVVAQIKVKDNHQEVDGVLCDALYDGNFCRSLLAAVARGRRFKVRGTELSAQPSKVFRQAGGGMDGSLEPSILKREQSNTSVIYGDRMILKLFRRVTEGLNPDLEIGRFLTEKARFAHTPPLLGAIEMRKGGGEPATLGILQKLVANEGDAWSYTLDSLGDYFEEIVTRKPDLQQASVPRSSPAKLADQEIPALARELIGSYLPSAHRLGQRTGELHNALGSETKDPAFAPEAFTALYRRSLYQSMRTMADQSLALLAKRLKSLPPEIRPDAEKILKLENSIFDRFREIVEAKITALRIRCHGDYHLGQVLFTGKDFFIIDFEGEPARPISERRLKRSPLRDVAGMLRSFNYAAAAALKSDGMREEDAVQLKPWASFWSFWVSVDYLKGYFEATRQSAFMPKSIAEIALMMDVYLLEKAVYELGYELNNRPDWVSAPIEGILELLGERE
jgi:maltose alpha-D-glucosyltransferase/alpha-amylase